MWWTKRTFSASRRKKSINNLNQHKNESNWNYYRRTVRDERRVKIGQELEKKEAVVQYESGQYPKSIVFQMMGDAIDKLNIQQGVEYDLELDFEAREWNNRYFLQASCWKATPTQQPIPHPASQPQTASAMEADNSDSDLPF